MKPQILIGDANAKDSLRLQQGLLDLGYSAAVCPDLPTVLTHLAQNPLTNLLFLAADLPGGEGLSALAAIRHARGDDLFVIVMVEEATDKNIFDGYRAGGDMVFRRPVHARELQGFLQGG